MNKIKKYLIPAGPLTVLEWGELWLKRLQPSAKSKVLLKWNATGKKPKPKSSKEYTNRRIKEETKRTWRSDVADIAHGIGEGVLALHPYTAIPYYGAKVSLDVVNGNVGLQTALNASIPLFHLAPAPASVGTVIDNTLEDVANAGSKTVKNLRVAREVKKLVNNINPSNLETFVDEYGRTITPTPWKGTDQSLIDLIAENLVNILKDYFVSPEKIALVKKTMKWGDKEYSEFLNELMRSIGTLSNGQVKGPKDGFTIIALHSGKALGEGSNMKGIHTMTFNRERIPNKKMAVEAIMHEIGGHGKTMSINPSKPSKISESFPRLTELMKKNLELADNILLLNNRGKFWNLFPNASDLELYLYNKGIHLHPKNTEQLFDQRRYFQYMTKDAQERAARAYTGLIMDKLGYDKTLNIKLLERYYTPESVEKYKNAVLNFGVPITGGYTLYNLLNNQNTNQLLEYKKRGGKMNIIEKFKKGSGIHIKKENRGKFTDYCGGKVTSACIAKGKNSSNPAIRKRATFAANARKWKHNNGGLIFKAEDGAKTNFWGKVGNFLNSDSGKSILGGLTSLYNNVLQLNQISNLQEENSKRIKAQKKAMINNIGDVTEQAKSLIEQQKLQNPNLNFGEIDLGLKIKLLQDLQRLDNILKANQWEYEQLLNLNDQIAAIQGNGYSNILQSGLGILSNFLGNKKTTTQQA